MHGLLFSEKNVEWYQTDGHKSDIDSATLLPSCQVAPRSTTWNVVVLPGRVRCWWHRGNWKRWFAWAKRVPGPSYVAWWPRLMWKMFWNSWRMAWIFRSPSEVDLFILFGNLYLFLVFFCFCCWLKLDFCPQIGVRNSCELMHSNSTWKKDALNLVTWYSVTQFPWVSCFRQLPVTGGISASTREKGQNKVQRLGWSPDPIHGSPYACHW